MKTSPPTDGKVEVACTSDDIGRWGAAAARRARDSQVHLQCVLVPASFSATDFVESCDATVDAVEEPLSAGKTVSYLNQQRRKKK